MLTMRLEDIGFYTLSDKRAENVSLSSPLSRCEILITDRCNFKCPYCRGMTSEQAGDIPLEDLNKVLAIWMDNGLRNVRFSGGEPTEAFDLLLKAVGLCKKGGVEHIAISTNGSKPLGQYLQLADMGVNDFSISLDACCAQMGSKMAGVSGKFSTVVRNIRELSRVSYVTVGMVFTEENVSDAVSSVLFADSLGVSDIRVIPSAQYNRALSALSSLSGLSKYKILNYRINNIRNGIPVRGLSVGDNHKCWLALDDMAVVKNKHYPCIIYLREHGPAIGAVDENVRAQRLSWIFGHSPMRDPICREMCLDVCVAYNRRVEALNPFVRRIGSFSR